MEAALGLTLAQERDQTACLACLVRDFSISFVPSLVSILAREMDDQVVLVAFAGLARA
jgi:hypothetical protein